MGYIRSGTNTSVGAFLQLDGNTASIPLPWLSGSPVGSPRNCSAKTRGGGRLWYDDMCSNVRNVVCQLRTG